MPRSDYSKVINIFIVVILLSCIAFLTEAYAEEKAGDNNASSEKEKTDAKNDSSPKDSVQTEPEQDYSMEVVVTGTRVETRNLKVPADIKVIGKERLQRPGTKNVLNALSEIAGVKINPRQENATFTDIEIRGLASNPTSGGNVLFLLDGIPQRRLSFGGPYMGALPYDAIVKMELVKGPSSSLYGRNALAGALQLFSDPGSEENTYDFMTSYEYPSNTGRASVKTAGPIGKKPISGTKMSTYSLAGSFGYAGGWQPENEKIQGDVYLHTNVRFSDKDTLTLLGGFFNTYEEAMAPVFLNPDGSRFDRMERDTNLSVPGQNYLKLQEYRAAAKYTRKIIDELLVKLTFAYWHGDSYWAVGRPSDRPDDGQTIVQRSASNRRFLENTYFTELEFVANYKPVKWLEGSMNLGGSYEYLSYVMTKTDITTKEAFADTNGSYIMGIPIDLYNPIETGRSEWVMSDESQRDTFEHDAGLFWRMNLSFIDRINVSGGFRYDYYKRKQINPDTSENAELNDWAISPGVGLNVAVFKMDNYKLNVYGNWGRGFSPVFRAVNNTKFADVSPESSESYEFGLKALLFGRKVEMNFAYFNLERKDIVAMNPDTKLQENIGNWTISGMETDIKVRPIKELTLYTSYTWRDPKITDFDADENLEGNKIPAISDHAFTLGAEGLAKFGLGGGTELRYVSKMQGNEQNSFVLPEYVLWDAWLFYDWKKKIRASIFIKNILDKEYFTAVFNRVANGSAFEGLPRTFGVSINGHF